MGFFSWKTIDTDRSICNFYSGKDVFPVTMTDNKGNRYHETCYEGYGVFGGKDYYELLAEMNGYENDDPEAKRLHGINLAFGRHYIENKTTKERFYAGGEDFFNWEHDIVFKGKSANQLLDTGKWISGVSKEKVLHPNLTEDPNWQWDDVEPDQCEYQGFFYPEENEDEFDGIYL